MKKLAFILFIFVLVTEIYASGFIKAAGGFNLSRYSGLHGNNIWKLRTGLEIGIGLETILSSRISFEVDGFITQKGSIEEVRNSDASYAYTLNYVLNEVSVPILLKIRLKADSSPYILAGGEISYISSHKYKVKEGYDLGLILPETKNVYLGLVFGCGYERKIGKISPFVEARY